MKRRAFFGALAATPAFGLAKVAEGTPPGKYGYVDISRARRLQLAPCEIFVNGVCVDRCVAFDDVEGWADFHYRGDDGEMVIHWHNGDRELATRRVHGVVTVRKHKPK